MIKIKKGEYQKHICECTLGGPRSYEVPYAINHLIDGTTLEIGGNRSLFAWVLCRRGWEYTIVDPILKEDRHSDFGTYIKEDIRKLNTKNIGTFDNVLLVSVLEHISLPAYGQSKDWKESPRKTQLEAFKYCMDFVKTGGRMIVTLPYTVKKEWKNPKQMLRYNDEMIKDYRMDIK